MELTARPDGLYNGTPDNLGPKFPVSTQWPNPVAQALSIFRTNPGAQTDVVWVVGDLWDDGNGPASFLSVGEKGDFGNYVRSVSNVSILGARGSDATLGRVFFLDKATPKPLDGLYVAGITFKAYQNSALHTSMNSGPGAYSGATFRECKFANPSTSFGTKWGARLHGPPDGWKFIRCAFTGFAEHGIYADNPTSGLEITSCIFVDCWRSGIQIANRKESGPVGSGDIQIRGCKFNGTGQSGAGCISITGNPYGDTIIAKCDMDSPHHTYGIVGYLETPWPAKGKLGGYTNGTGRAFRTLAIEKCDINLPDSKAGIDLSAVENLYVIDDNTWKDSPRPALWLDRPDSPGGVSNLNVKLITRRSSPWTQASKWGGWPSTEKVRQGSKTLSDAEIDALGVVR